MEAAPQTYALDASAERSVGRLRLLGAFVVAPAGIVWALQGPGTVGWVLIALAWIASLGWISAWARARRRIRRSDEWALRIDSEGLCLRLGGLDHVVGWNELRGVEVDEERLVVVIERTDGSTLRVPPLFNAGLYDLKEALEQRHQRWATSHANPGPKALRH